MDATLRQMRKKGPGRALKGGGPGRDRWTALAPERGLAAEGSAISLPILVGPNGRSVRYRT
jgi:hypothetical protein